MRLEEVQEYENTGGIQPAQDMVQYRDTVKNPEGSTRSGKLN
jgi:hypothetical protein